MNSISFKNFRNCGETISKIVLHPISIFTGCNSAGKSSAAKALILLNSYLKNIKENNNNLIATSIDFSKIVKLGTFDQVLNIQAKENGANSIMLGFSTDSFFNVGEIEYQFYFTKKEGDFLENGWLNSLVVNVNNSSLFTINIINDQYQIAINNTTNFVEYFRNYMIGQLAAAFRYANNYKKYIESNEVNFKNRIERKDENVEFIDSILSLDLHLIIEEEMRLVAENKINKLRYISDLDIKNLKGITQSQVDGLLAYVLKYEAYDSIITRIETEKGSKLEKLDIERVIKEYIKISEEKIASTAVSSPNSDFVTHYLNKKLHKQKKELIDSIEKYIDSYSTCRIEYIREQEDNLIYQFANDYNKIQKDFKNDILKTLQFLVGYGGFECFIQKIIKDAISPDFCGNLSYIDTSIVEVKRLYPIDDLSRFGKSWRIFNKISRQYQDNDIFSTIKPGEFMQKWLREFGICEELVVSNVEGAISIRLISNEVPEGRLLADYGYGVTQLLSLLLNIEIALNNVRVNYDDEINFYFSGIDPVYKTRPYWIIIEEPEVHLHPRLQSKLADMFRDAVTHGARFIIETHSEYMVRRTQAIVAQMEICADELEKNNPFKVYYFPENGTPYDMVYQSNGHFEESFGEGFFDEAGKWVRALTRSKKIK